MAKRVAEKAQKAVDVLAEIAKDAKLARGLRRFDDIEEVPFVPTFCTSYNRAVEHGGHPLGTITDVHGENQTGKSVFALLILMSFKAMGHYAEYQNIERVAHRKWLLDELKVPQDMGYFEPDNLEHLIDHTQGVIAKVGALRGKKGTTRVITCADTLSECAPRDTVEMILDADVDKKFPAQAAMLSLWLKAYVPLIHDELATAIFVSQMRANLHRQGKFDPDSVPAVIRSIQHNASIRVCIRSVASIKMGSKEDAYEIGTQHRARVIKNKVGGRRHEFMFFTANGRGDCPAGFDHAREVVAECEFRGPPFYEKRGKGNAQVIVSQAFGSEFEGEAAMRQFVRENLDACRKKLDADVPRFVESQKGRREEGADADARDR